MDSIPVAIPVSQPYQSTPITQQPLYNPSQPIYIPPNGGLINQGKVYIPAANQLNIMEGNPGYPPMYENISRIYF